MGLFSGLWPAKFNLELPPYDSMNPEDRRCRRRARDAEWNFRVSRGYEKDTFWNRLKCRMTHRD